MESKDADEAKQCYIKEEVNTESQVFTSESLISGDLVNKLRLLKRPRTKDLTPLLGVGGYYMEMSFSWVFSMGGEF